MGPSHRNGLRLSKLVNTLLDFARIEAGRLEATYEPTKLPALTRDLASAFRSAIERAGLRLRSMPRPPQPAYVDRDMWEKIVLNLLSNALKFTFEGEIAVSSRARVMGSGSPSPIPARASRPRSCPICSTGSIASGASPHPRGNRHRSGARPGAGPAARG